ncbi:DUF883 family protein [Phytohalomonas tamaricis]|uniref:DUF883 family protein n=1 Tax=Phytohalomonas tamaricis TaxID=2081032 RepID=UPI000D0B318D|nr:YqjD family protein [Phytohalomonas tamaricis]
MAMYPTDKNDRDVSKEQLREDLRQLSQTVEELMNASAEDNSERMSKLRKQAEVRLQATRARLAEKSDYLRSQTRDITDCCDNYVHENPWRSVGIGTAVGVFVGLLLGRR